MKKFDIRTRQGRARRRYNESLFNPSSLQPHDKAHREDIWFRKDLGGGAVATYRIKRDGEVVLEGVHAVSEEAAVERAYIGWNRKVPKDRIEAVEMK